MAAGSIIQLDKDVPRAKCRHWLLQISNGKNLATGKYRRITKRFHGTYTQAQNALRGLTPTNSQHASTTFAAYAKTWLKRRESGTHGTYRVSCDRIKCALLHLQAAKLTEITPAALENMYAKLLAGASPSGKPLSRTYVSDIAACLHTLFRDAVRDGLLTSNPCDKAKPPARDTQERKALNISQIHEITDVLNPTHPNQLAILLCIKTGIRRGEAHGLSWCDIDDCIHIRHAYDDGGNLKPPKTRKSVRTLPITKSVKTDLETARERAKRLNLPTKGDAPVICNELGERILPHSTSAWWRKHRAALGFDGWTVHELRHSYLSELARRGVSPRVLQEIAGHESYKTTEEIYVHVKAEQLAEAVKNVDW